MGCLTVASEDGTLTCWDVRKFSEKTPLWSLVSNEYGGVSDLCYNPCVPGMLATCSVDKTVTLWDSYSASSGELSSESPRVCGTKDMGVGKLYTVNFYPSAPWLMGCAGGCKELAIWDMTREDAIQKRFSTRAVANVGPVVADEATQKEALDAMMSAEASSAAEGKDVSSSTTKKKKKKGSNKKKKKVHRA